MKCAANSIFDCAGVWAGGFTEPSRYGSVYNFLQNNSQNRPQKSNLRGIFDEKRLDEIF